MESRAWQDARIEILEEIEGLGSGDATAISYVGITLLGDTPCRQEARRARSKGPDLSSCRNGR